MEKDIDMESTCESVTDFTARIVQKCCKKRIMMGDFSGDNRNAGFEDYSTENITEIEGSEELFDEKENAKPQGGIRTASKKTFKRLGDLYSEENVLSSPVHRNESMFALYDSNSPGKLAKPKARLARLAALANQIKEWEDDMSHPVIKKEVEKTQRKKWTRETSVSSPKKMEEISSSPSKNASTTKKSEITLPSAFKTDWDKSVLATLEAQGFSRTPEKSPKKGKVVREIAAKYEDSPPIGKKNFKDPAELSLAERRAIFEKSGNTPVIPKAPLAMAIPSQPLGQSSPTIVQKNVLSSRLALFESNQVTVPEVNDCVKDEIERRKNEIEDLKNRWKKTLQSIEVKKVEDITAAVKDFENDLSSFFDWLVKTQKKVEELELIPENDEKVLEKIKEYDFLHSEILKRNVVLNDLIENGTKLMAKIPNEATLLADQIQEVTDKFSLLVDTSDSLEGLKQFQLSYLKLQTWMGCMERKLVIDKRTCSNIKDLESEICKNPEINEILENGSKIIKNLTKEDEGQRLQTKIEFLQNRYEKLKQHKNQVVSFKDVPEPPPISPLISNCSPGSPSKMGIKSKYPGINVVKRIRLSPTKPGRLYPSVSDIETETESEIQTDRDDDHHSSYEGESETDESLGGHIVKVASSSNLGCHSTLKDQNKSRNLKHVEFEERLSESSDSSRSRDESRVLHEIDDFLDEALGEPSPKRSRDSSYDGNFSNRGMVSYPSTSCHSASFEYTDGKSIENEIGNENKMTVEATGGIKLVHTVSVYRKQQGQLYVKPTTVIKRIEKPEVTQEVTEKELKESENEMVTKKIHDLLLEISKQQTIIAQSSQALNLCSSTLEFSGSTEQIEGEKLLLIATNRRQASLHELERLRIEKTLKPGGGSLRCEKGNLVIKEIILPIKNEVIRRAARDENCYYIVCLARCGEIVLASEMIQAISKNVVDGKLTFKKPLEFKSLYGSFALTVEVYALLARSKEILPHEVKYHINPKKERKATPKKIDKKLLIGGRLESPGGPNIVRSPLFQLNGFIVFSLRDINKSTFTLNKVPYDSVVEGTVRISVKSSMSLDVEHRGFLTMFEDISGFGAWHRRWCLLRGDKISYWKYPEDEQTKVPMDTIDLSQCLNEEIGQVSREFCARPNTFLVETIRPILPDDKDTLAVTVNRKEGTTRIRHLLSADIREERVEWCEFLNKTLGLLRAWGNH